MDSRKTRIEVERNEFNEWKSSISCYGDPKKGDEEWIVTMDGPKDSPYMGGKFKISIKFPSGYPKKVPIVKFQTPIYHLNINSEGTICLSSLTYKYNENISIIDILTQIFMMLTSPNIDSPLVGFDIIKEYNEDYSGYLAKAREMTREHAK